jgi:hypothetical protein
MLRPRFPTGITMDHRNPRKSWICRGDSQPIDPDGCHPEKEIGCRPLAQSLDWEEAGCNRVPTSGRAIVEEGFCPTEGLGNYFLPLR